MASQSPVVPSSLKKTRLAKVLKHLKKPSKKKSKKKSRSSIDITSLESLLQRLNNETIAQMKRLNERQRRFEEFTETSLRNLSDSIALLFKNQPILDHTFSLSPKPTKELQDHVKNNEREIIEIDSDEVASLILGDDGRLSERKLTRNRNLDVVIDLCSNHKEHSPALKVPHVASDKTLESKDLTSSSPGKVLADLTNNATEGLKKPEVKRSAKARSQTSKKLGDLREGSSVDGVVPSGAKTGKEQPSTQKSTVLEYAPTSVSSVTQVKPPLVSETNSAIGDSATIPKRLFQPYNYELAVTVKVPDSGMPITRPSGGWFLPMENHTDLTHCAKVEEVYKQWFFDDFAKNEFGVPCIRRRDAMYGESWYRKNKEYYIMVKTIISFIEWIYLDYAPQDILLRLPKLVYNPLKGSSLKYITSLLDIFQTVGGPKGVELYRSNLITYRESMSLNQLADLIKKDSIAVAQYVFDLHILALDRLKQ